jgi:hypothetical protein
MGNLNCQIKRLVPEFTVGDGPILKIHQVRFNTILLPAVNYVQRSRKAFAQTETIIALFAVNPRMH